MHRAARALKQGLVHLQIELREHRGHLWCKPSIAIESSVEQLLERIADNLDDLAIGKKPSNVSKNSS